MKTLPIKNNYSKFCDGILYITWSEWTGTALTCQKKFLKSNLDGHVWYFLLIVLIWLYITYGYT